MDIICANLCICGADFWNQITSKGEMQSIVFLETNSYI